MTKKSVEAAKAQIDGTIAFYIVAIMSQVLLPKKEAKKFRKLLK